MSTQAVRSVEAALALLTPNWLWTWNGVCFGYRRGDSLFTHDGTEVGRFAGAEVYGADGGYLGEIRSTENDGDRLITSSYKKFRMAASFMPATERAQKRPAARDAQPLFCGHEDFPTPEILKARFRNAEAYQGGWPNADPTQ
jgi:hypothetical protein